MSSCHACRDRDRHREREKQLPASNQSTGGNGEEFVNSQDTTMPCTCTCTCMGIFVHRGEVDIQQETWQLLDSYSISLGYLTFPLARSTVPSNSCSYTERYGIVCQAQMRQCTCMGIFVKGRKQIIKWQLLAIDITPLFHCGYLTFPFAKKHNFSSYAKSIY